MKVILSILTVLSFSLNVPAQRNPNINVLIIQDMGHHDTKMQAETFKMILKESLDYQVDILMSTENKRWSENELNLSNYQLIITSTLGFENLPKEPLDQITRFIENGGGLVVVHQGVGSYEKEPKFQELIGIGWYGSHTGSHIFWNDDKNDWAETPIYHGVAPAHGKQHEMIINIRNSEHPITKGMPLNWKHGMDEFYHGMRGYTKSIKVLATAYSDKELWGSGENEPIAWTNSYGKGNIFVTVLGHIFNEDNAEDIPGINSSENGTNAIYCVGFQTLFARGSEWAATGSVNLRLPSNFPTENQTIILSPNEVKWSK